MQKLHVFFKGYFKVENCYLKGAMLNIKEKIKETLKVNR